MQLPRIEHLGRPVAHRRRVVAAGLSTYRVRTAVTTGRWQQPLGRRCTPWLVAALADARRGMRSVGENDLRRVVVAAGLPEPEWNAEVETPWGTFFVDALWRRERVAAEADGAAFHLSADDWQADLRRQNAIQGTGLTLFRFPVRRLRAEPQACGCELGAVLR